MKFETKRELLYGGPLARAKRYHYVTYLAATQIATGETRELAEQAATDALLGAFQQETATIHASITDDGHIFTTREYRPGYVETAHIRKDRQSGVCMSRCEIEGRRVTVAEYHAHYLAMYNDATRPEPMRKESAA